MKKYLFGIMAIAMAIGFSAFTTPAKKTNQYLFGYDGPNFSQSEVAKVSNWTYIGLYSNQESCDENIKEQACQITVDESKVSDQQITLEALTVEESTTTDQYVPSVTGDVPHSFSDLR